MSPDGQLGNLSARYFVAMDQLSLAPDTPKEPEEDIPVSQIQLTL